jgi:hypothetical protein
MNMPKMVELPMIAASPGVVKPDLIMNGISEPSIVKSMTSKKYPAAISPITRRCSGYIFASSNDEPTNASMVWAI